MAHALNATRSFVWLEPYLCLLSWQNLVLDRGENGFLHIKVVKFTTTTMKDLPFEMFTKTKIKGHLFKCVVVKVLLIKEFCLKASKFSPTPNLSLCGIFVLPPVCQIPSAKVNFS